MLAPVRDALDSALTPCAATSWYDQLRRDVLGIVHRVTWLPYPYVDDTSLQDLESNRQQEFSQATTMYASGLTWIDLGHSQPGKGRLLVNAQLASDLTSKTEFTEHEWDAFGITDLRVHDWIQSSDGRSFTPITLDSLAARGCTATEINPDQIHYLHRCKSLSLDSELGVALGWAIEGIVCPGH
jgi:hypothetical protein